MSATLRLVIGLSIVLCSLPAISQVPDRRPDQRYRIDARLDPESRILEGSVVLDYTHTGQDVLDHLVFHAWANAFSEPGTAFDRQKLKFGDVKEHYRQPKDRVRYTNLSFHQGSDSLRQTSTEGPDVIRVALAQPLSPGSTVRIEARFRMAVPGFHSRMGTDGRIWQLAHWFPKVARREKGTFITTPYLEMGEFYQDFADYSVLITLPDSFTLVSTGMPADPATSAHRREALERSATRVPGLSATSNGTRTWAMEAQWVTDFTWAASREFLLRDTVIRLSGSRSAIGQVAYTPEKAKSWDAALGYIARSVHFYDSLVGPYPWPQASAVQGVKGFPGGMEYPMLTFIDDSSQGKSLDIVIGHEVGHNWFYGILATNERSDPWMDEGLNSYYEHRYEDAYYPSDAVKGLSLDAAILAADAANKRRIPIPREGVTNLRSEMDYLLGAYALPAYLFAMLEAKVGAERLDAAFQDYFRKWSFGHPSPEDAQTSFENSLGMDLSWLFEVGLGKPLYRDQKILSAERSGADWTVRVANRYQKTLPWRLQVLRGDSLLAERWFDGFIAKDTLVRIAAEPGADRLLIPHDGVSELRLGNNQWRTKGWPRRYADWKPGFGAGILHSEKSRTYFLPVAGFNVNDGFQAGLAVHNQKAFYQPAGFWLSGLYGFRSERLNGQATLYHDVYPGGGPDQLRVAVRAATFTHFRNEDTDVSLAYHRIAPSLEWQTAQDPTRGQIHWKAGLYSWFVRRETAIYDIMSETFRKGHDWDRIFAARVSRERPDALAPWKLAADLEFQAYRNVADGSREAYLKAGFEANYAWQFAPKRYMKARAFAGFFPFNSRREAPSVSSSANRGSFALAFQGHNDYRYEGTYLDRNVYEADGPRQVMLREGGFKTALGPAFSAGQSNDMILAVNLWSSLPFRLPLGIPLQPYFDAGFWSDRTPLGSDKSLSDQIWWDFGLKLGFFGERMEIYMPLVQNDALSDLLKQQRQGFWNRITWSARFDLAQLPWSPLGLF